MSAWKAPLRQAALKSTRTRPSGRARTAPEGKGRAQQISAQSLELFAVAAVDGGRGVEVHAEGELGQPAMMFITACTSSRAVIPVKRSLAVSSRCTVSRYWLRHLSSLTVFAVACNGGGTADATTETNGTTSSSGGDASSSSADTSSTGAETTETTATTAPTTGSVCEPGETQDCFSGPPGTDGVGVCAAGLATCTPDGLGFGPCEGEVTPAQEDCATADDEDCDGDPTCAPVGQHQWSRHFATTSGETIVSVRSSMGGALRIAGNYSDPLDLGGGKLPYKGGGDVFLAGFTADGTHEWSVGLGGPETQRAVALCPSEDGGVYLLGEYGLSFDFGDGPVAGDLMGLSTFVARFGPKGEHVWSRGIKADGNVSYFRARDVACDATGVVVVGPIGGTVDFGGGPVASKGEGDLLIARYTGDGSLAWAQRYGDEMDQDLYSVARHPSGDFVICGEFWGAIDLGGGPLVSAGTNDVLVARLKADGSHVWSQRHGDIAGEGCVRVATGPTGEIVIATDVFQEFPFDLGGDVLQGTDTSNCFLAQYDATGAHQWSRRCGSAWQLSVSDLAVDTGGRVTVTGVYETSDPFDVGLLLPAGKHPEGSTFLAQYDPNGTPLWGYVYDLPLFGSIVVDALGDIVLGSGFAESFDFGGGLLENLGYDDAVLTKIRPE